MLTQRVSTGRPGCMSARLCSLRGSVAFSLALLVAAATAPRLRAEAPTLHIGDAMPTLSGVRWLTDARVPSWEKGHAYVLQFWAPWCAPCIAEFPELSGLARDLRQSNVHVAGVAVMASEGTMPPGDFLAKRNDVDYAMAEDVDDWARTQLLHASGSDNIPMIMLVNRDGRLAWVGLVGDEFHETLQRIVDGSFDMDSAIQADQLRLRGLEIRSAAADAERAEDWERVAALWKQMGELDPQRYGWIWVDVYQLYLSHLYDPAQANQAAERFFDGPFGEDPGGLLVLVARIIGSQSEIPPKWKDLDMALRAATLAASIDSNMKAGALVKVAQVQYQRGELDASIAALEQAIDLLPADDEDRPQLLKALDQLREERNGR